MSKLATPTETIKAFMSMSVGVTLTASYHERTDAIFLEGWVKDEYGLNRAASIMLDVDQAKTLINELTVAVTR